MVKINDHIVVSQTSPDGKTKEYSWTIVRQYKESKILGFGSRYQDSPKRIEAVDSLSPVDLKNQLGAESPLAKKILQYGRLGSTIEHNGYSHKIISINNQNAVRSGSFSNNKKTSPVSYTASYVKKNREINTIEDVFTEFESMVDGFSERLNLKKHKKDKFLGYKFVDKPVYFIFFLSFFESNPTLTYRDDPSRKEVVRATITIENSYDLLMIINNLLNRLGR